MMIGNLAWLAPLAWAVAALVAMLVLKARTTRPNTPEPTQKATPIRRAA